MKNPLKNLYNYIFKIKDTSWGKKFYLDKFLERSQSFLLYKLLFPFYPLSKRSLLKGAIQKEVELASLIYFLRRKNINTVLEIGTE